ncbi:MAG: hypothetical protein J0I66_03970, partial [Microbacterium sp.]|nr:hypothetical protein [Microbacterium sp.]
MKFRSSLALAAAAALALSLVGCTGGGGNAASSGAATGACAASPKAGGKIVVGKQNETLSLSPYATPGGFGDTEALNM